MKKIILLFVCIVLLPLQFAHAQDAGTLPLTNVNELPSAEMEVIAEVDMFDAHIIEQKGHELMIEFTFHNGQGAQSDVRYAAQLMAYDDGTSSQSMVYQKVFDDPTTLAEKSSLYKKFTLAIPSYISGKYDVLLVSENSDGLPLASASLGEVDLYGDYAPYVKIDDTTCHLFVKGLPEDYTLDQGVDVAENETLALSCEIQNFFDTDIVIQPSVQTYLRSLFGNKVDSTILDQKIQLEPQEKNEVVIDIPTQKTPQAYSVAVTFVSDQKKDVSNAVYAHYVARGESASISNFQLDKSSYKNGEEIVAEFLATASADNFPGARSEGTNNGTQYYNVTIKDADGKECIDPVKRVALKTADEMVVVKAKSSRECMYPQVSASIENEKGKILVEKKYDFLPTEKDAEQVDQKTDEGMSMNMIAWFVIGGLTVIAFIVIFGSKIKNRGMKFIAIFFMSGSMFLVIQHDAQALTVRAPIAGDAGSYAVCDFGLSKNTLTRGEKFQGRSSNCKVSFCGNLAKMEARINGENVASWALTSRWEKKPYTIAIKSGNVTLTAGNECKQYSVPVSVQFWHYYNKGSKTIPSGWSTKLSTGSLPYEVVNCDSVDGKFDAVVSDCADGVTRSGKVAMQVTNVTGSGAGSVEYRFKCGASAWTGWTTNATYTCSFINAGQQTVYAQIKRGTAITPVKSVQVSVPLCVDGKCNPGAMGDYIYADKKFRLPLCADGTTPVKPVGFHYPEPGETVSWGCNGIGPNAKNTEPNACSARRVCPTFACGTAGTSNAVRDTKPTVKDGLCVPADALINQPGVTFGQDGRWSWGCKYADADQCQGATCSAPSCIVNNPPTLQPYVYFDGNGKPSPTTMTVSCPNICCDIAGAEGSVTVCNGTPGQIPVFAGARDYTMSCWYDDDNDGKKDENDTGASIVSKTGRVSTMCAARSCNNQGQCQATPQEANSPSDCASSCSSDADCTTGRMIETRP